MAAVAGVGTAKVDATALTPADIDIVFFDCDDCIYFNNWATVSSALLSFPIQARAEFKVSTQMQTTHRLTCTMHCTRKLTG
jgi:hypothetical protein